MVFLRAKWHVSKVTDGPRGDGGVWVVAVGTLHRHVCWVKGEMGWHVHVHVTRDASIHGQVFTYIFLGLFDSGRDLAFVCE